MRVYFMYQDAGFKKMPPLPQVWPGFEPGPLKSSLRAVYKDESPYELPHESPFDLVHIRFPVRYESAPILIINWSRFNFSGNIIFAFLFREVSFHFCFLFREMSFFLVGLKCTKSYGKSYGNLYGKFYCVEMLYFLIVERTHPICSKSYGKSYTFSNLLQLQCATTPRHFALNQTCITSVPYSLTDGLQKSCLTRRCPYCAFGFHC
jgi:hypothetical protein